MQQYLKVKREHPDTVLLYRLGDFYETFFEDAHIMSKELELTLTGRDAGKIGRIPLAGIPFKAADNYIKRLIEKGFKVAVCEQLQDPKEAKGIVDRGVVRIVTPGTLIENDYLEKTSNNYICAIFQEKDSFEKLEQTSIQLKTKLTEQFEKSDKAIQLGKNIDAAKKGLATAENNLAQYHRELAATQKQSQIDILGDLIKTAKDMKDTNEAELNEYQKTMASYYKQYIQDPLEQFTQQEKAIIGKNKIKTTRSLSCCFKTIKLTILFIS